MPDRKSLVSTLWLTSSLVLLASLLAAPVRTSGMVIISLGPDTSHRTFALLSEQPTTFLTSAIVTDAGPRVNALPSENEEQDRADTLDGPRVTFLNPCSFRKIPDRQSIDPRSILSHYPLRC